MILSKQNKQFKTWVKLKTKKYRDLEQMFLVYGKHLIELAKENNALVDIITSNEEKEGILISEELMKELQQTSSWIDEIGLCKKSNPIISSDRVLVLDDVQDPDNVGALLRSASAFGFNHIILSHQSADIYNEKTIRASKGALFQCFIERKPLDEAIKDLKEHGYYIVGADAHQSHDVHVEHQKIALILGNEGHGINNNIKPLIDQFVTIETKHVESLNVSVAGAIIMYEWRNF